MRKFLIFLMLLVSGFVSAQTEPPILSDSDTKVRYIAEDAYMTYSSGNFVSQWADATGNGYYLWQPTPGDVYLPTFADNTVTFDTDLDQLEQLTFTQSQPLTVYFVGRLNGLGNGYRDIIDMYQLDIEEVLTGDDADSITVRLSSNPGFLYANRRVAVGDYTVMTATFTGSSSSFRLNDEVAATGGSINADSIATRVILSHNAMNMDVKEVIIRGVDDTGTDEDAIINYLMVKYNVNGYRDIGGDYFVATDGSDSNPGTYEQPFATWQKAINVAMPGDTVYIRGGVYYNLERLEINPEKYGGAIGASGTKDNPITYMGYPGEWPILDCSHHCDNHPVGSNFYNGAIAMDYVEHIKFKDFEIRNVFQCDSVMNGAISATYSRYLSFDHIIMHDIGERGYYIMGGAWQSYYEDMLGTANEVGAPYWPTEDDTTRFINCDTYNLMDSLSTSPGNAADGWKTIHYRGNVLIWENCRAWNFTDDGIDPNIINGAIRYITNCWIIPRMTFIESTPDWNFEQNGIKTSGIANGLYVNSPISDDFITMHLNNNIVSFSGGAGYGFIEDGEVDHRMNAEVFNNIAYKCNISYYLVGTGTATYPHTIKFFNNIDYESRETSAVGPGTWYGVYIPHDNGYCYNESHNTWDCDDGYPYGVVTDTVTVTDADFVNIDSATIVQQLTAPRKADGSLPDITVFQLAVGSDLIDAGVDVGLPYTGAAPDLGPFEYNPIIADHTVVDRYDDIPDNWIDSVKTMWFDISGESHSVGYYEGLDTLETIDSKFQVVTQIFGTPATPRDTELRANKMIWGDINNTTGWTSWTGEEDWWTSAAAISQIETGLSYCNTNNLELDVLGFGWCWDGTYGTPTSGTDPVTGNRWWGETTNGPEGAIHWGLDDADNAVTGNSLNMDDYLEATQSFIDYCITNNIDTKVIFTTGPVDDIGGGAIDEQMYQGHLKWEHIREYVNADPSRILFDYADILCYDNDGSQTTSTWNGNTFPVITPTNLGAGDRSHIGSEGTLRLAKAVWWMMARIAGWDGGDVVEYPLTANAGSNITINDSDNSGSESTILDGSNSFGGGTITSYVWTENSTQIATGIYPNVSFTVGAHTITLTVTDNNSDIDTDNVIVTITPYAAPPSNDSIIIISDTMLTDSILNNRQPGDTLYLKTDFSVNHDFSMSGTVGSPIIVKSHKDHRAAFNTYQVITGDYLRFEGVDFNNDTYVQGDNITMQSDNISNEGLTISGGNASINNNVFTNCDTAIYVNEGIEPDLQNNTFNAGAGNVYQLKFPATDWRGYDFIIDNNIYNISPSTKFNGMPWGSWRPTFPKYDNNSTFNVTP